MWKQVLAAVIATVIVTVVGFMMTPMANALLSVPDLQTDVERLADDYSDVSSSLASHSKAAADQLATIKALVIALSFNSDQPPSDDQLVDLMSSVALMSENKAALVSRVDVLETDGSEPLLSHLGTSTLVEREGISHFLAEATFLGENTRWVVTELGLDLNRTDERTGEQTTLATVTTTEELGPERLLGWATELNAVTQAVAPTTGEFLARDPTAPNDGSELPVHDSLFDARERFEMVTRDPVVR